jgi:hypothetical protein
VNAGTRVLNLWVFATIALILVLCCCRIFYEILTFLHKFELKIIHHAPGVTCFYGVAWGYLMQLKNFSQAVSINAFLWICMYLIS